MSLKLAYRSGRGAARISTFKFKYSLFILLSTFIINCQAAQKTWTGTTDTAWTTASNWSPSGVPASTDTVTIVTGSNQCHLTQNTTVNRITLTSGTLQLHGFTLTVNNHSTFNGGTVSGTANPALILRGTRTTFAGTTVNAIVETISNRVELNGSTFNNKCYLEQTGGTTSNGTGSNTFNDTVTLANSGTANFNLAQNTGDIYHALLKVYMTGTHDLIVSKKTSYFNGNIELNMSGSGEIYLGTADGDSSYLASGKTISAGDSGITGGVVIFNKFIQQGNTSQTLTATSNGSSGNGVFNMISSVFNGTLNVTAPVPLFKNNVFYGAVNVTKTTNISALSDGGNRFYGDVTIDNNSVQQVRFANNTRDKYYGNVSFIGSSTGVIRPFYNDTTEVHGNLSVTSNKVELDANNGIVRFAGNNNQTVSGNLTVKFKNPIIEKTGGHVTLDTSVSVSGTLKLVRGNIITTSAHLLTMLAGSSVTGASNSSFVSGPVKKVGNTAFTFPTGKGIAFLPIKISSTLSSTDAFTAESFNTRQLFGNNFENPIEYVSEYNYWNIERNNGNSKVKINFNWDSRYNPVPDTAILRIAKWDANQWKDRGHGQINGNYSYGNMLTPDSINSFGYFAFAYSAYSDTLHAFNDFGFIRNDGQILDTDTLSRPDISFITLANGSYHFFYDTAVAHVFKTFHTDTIPDSLYRVDMRIVNAYHHARPRGIDISSNYTNYMLGYLEDHVVNVPNFKTIQYDSIYKLIDLRFKKSNGLGFEFYIHPGGRPDLIVIEFEGQDDLFVNEERQLTLTSPLGSIIYNSVFAETDSNGIKIPVDVEILISDKKTLQFSLGHYNADYPLIISIPPVEPYDPIFFGNLYWSSYVSSGYNLTDLYLDESSNSFATIGFAGNVLLPGSPSGLQNNNVGQQDLMIVKFNANRGISWATFLGGSLNEFDNAQIRIMPNGEISFAGRTNSPNLPAASNPCTGCYAEPKHGFFDLFTGKLNANGDALNWITYFGGSQDVGLGGEELHSMTHDLQGNLYLGGVVFLANDFPEELPSGAYNQAFGNGGSNGNDPFISKFNAANELVWSTSIGGNNDIVSPLSEEVTGMCTDASGNLYITGTTGSSGTSPHLSSPCTLNSTGAFPLVNPDPGNCFVEDNHGGTDSFFMKFDSQNRIVWSTMFGGYSTENFANPAHNNKGIAVNGNGDIISIGSTLSDNNSFFMQPSGASGAYNQSDIAGGWDAFIVRFNQPTGQANKYQHSYSTFFGGTGNDFGLGVAVDGFGSMYFTGTTLSSDLQTKDPGLSTGAGGTYYQDAPGGSDDAFLIKINTNLKHLLTTYFGGNGNDEGKTIACNASGNNVLLAGPSSSTSTSHLADIPGTLDYFNPSGNSSYAANLINICTNCKIISPQLTDNQVYSNGINIIPNPANDIISVVASESEPILQVTIIDITGNAITVNAQIINCQAIVDVSEIVSGIYILLTKTKNKEFKNKIIIQN